jgi:hypothetical protein
MLRDKLMPSTENILFILPRPIAGDFVECS